MSVIWAKVWFDLWHSKLRTLLAVLSIAAGVFAVGATFGLSDLLLSGMDAAHQAVTPSHIQMYLNQYVDRDTILALRKVPGVAGVEPDNEIDIRYKTAPGASWKDGLLVERDNYAAQTYDVVQLKEGVWPARDGVGIERLTSQYYHMDIGDQVIFEVNKREKSLPITGKIRHPFVPPPQFGGEAVFFVDAVGMERFGVAQGTFGHVYARVTPYSSDFARQVASDIKDRLAKEGITVDATLYQDPLKHWGRPYVEGIVLVCQVLAVISLFTSVVLVLNTLMALITQQTNQIGVLKAIGGTAATIVKVYLAGVVVYGLLALLVSLPLGMLLAYGSTRWLLNVFNIDYTQFHWSTTAVALQAGAALGVPLLAALIPVLRGAHITVREAMASYGLGGDFGSGRLDRLVERVGGRLLPPAYSMAITNSFRRKGRLALSLLVLATAGSMFLMVMSLSSSINATLDTEFARRSFDAQISFEHPERIDEAVPLAEAQNGVARATMWYEQPVTILLDNGQKAHEAGVSTDLIGLPLDDPMYRPPIVAGRWLGPRDQRAVVISQQTADDNHIPLGGVITLDLGTAGKTQWQVVGMYKMVFGGMFSSDGIYGPQEAVFDAAKKNARASTLYVRADAHTPAAESALATSLAGTLAASNMPVSETTTTADDRGSAEKQFAIVIGMLLALAVIVATVGGIGLAGSLWIGVIERTREIGVLRAIGARSRTIRGMLLLEGVLQAAVSWAIAVPVSLVVGRPVANSMGQTMFSASLTYRYNVQAVAVWLIVVLVIAAGASLAPARLASRISVRASLAYE